MQRAINRRKLLERRIHKVGELKGEILKRRILKLLKLAGYVNTEAPLLPVVPLVQF
jgi:hypothetical protein